MTDYIVKRSVTDLEQEIAELEGQEVVKEPVQEEVVKDEAPLNKEEETWKKRYSDLRRNSQKQADEIKQLKELALKPSAPVLDLSSPEEAAKWAKENPKAAAIIRALANEQVTTLAPKNDDVIAIRQELDKNKQETRIKQAHPDFEAITSDDKFHDWAESQTQSVQNLIYDGSADDIIWAISLYKKEGAFKESNPNKEAAKAVTNKLSSAPADNGNKKSFAESQVQKMSMQEYEKNEAAISQSMRDGSFIYDLSGAAR